MNFANRKWSSSRWVPFVALALVVILVLGLVGGIIRKRAHSDEAPPSIPSVRIELISKEKLGNLSSVSFTAASYGLGTHVAAVNYPDRTVSKLILTTDGGETWKEKELVQTNTTPLYDSVVDEIVRSGSKWYIGLSSYEETFDHSYGSILYIQGGGFDGQLTLLNTMHPAYHCGGEIVAMKNNSSGYCYAMCSHGHFYKAVYNEEPLDWGFHVPSEPDTSLVDFIEIENVLYVLGRHGNDTVLYITSDRFNNDTRTVLFSGVRANNFENDGAALLLVCDEGKIVRYEDGATRTAQMPEKDVSFTDIFFFGGKYFAIGSGENIGVVYESSNGYSWSRLVKSRNAMQAASVGREEAMIYSAGGDVYRLTVTK